MQRFQLIRREDVSGCSGTGAVAEGVIFSDGTAVMRWNVAPYSLAIYGSVDDLIQVHGHEGRTVLQVIDQPAPREFPSG
ncbi:hypothetical protein E7T06_07210 [Deinococcus sp. Arct2-2]|nr:hypothetical protein E7T06_07210 [Deinococcus sp. Arct2-2]